jgi:hypothetical protein
VAPIIFKDDVETLGEWSDTESIGTTELQSVDPLSLSNHAAYY